MIAHVMLCGQQPHVNYSMAIQRKYAQTCLWAVAVMLMIQGCDQEPAARTYREVVVQDDSKRAAAGLDPHARLFDMNAFDIGFDDVVKDKEKGGENGTFSALFVVLGWGMTLSFFGTMLGGVWADQSWGRFWGWDPKENGALMIILWTAAVFHAKVSRMIGRTGFAAGAVLGMVVVMWAWFGVNLLSVGLHSYGFTSGIGTALAVYVAAEMLFLAICLPIIYRKKEVQNARET